MLTAEQITSGATDLWPCPLGQISQASDLSQMWQWRASEGAGLLQEDITYLSGAEIVVHMIRLRKKKAAKANKQAIHYA